tara:strand:- start:22489 stop:22761 length:273 start_codon:yes stop_codon:yes gene_type:complete
MSKNRRAKKLDKWGYYSNSEDTTEAIAHGYEPKYVARGERKDGKRDYKLDKTAQKTELIKAKGTRLKWLVILIGLVMGGFAAFKTGIFGG